MEFSRCTRDAPAREKTASRDGLSKLNSVHVEVDVVSRRVGSLDE
jgi:hypothetical protein